MGGDVYIYVINYDLEFKRNLLTTYNRIYNYTHVYCTFIV